MVRVWVAGKTVIPLYTGCSLSARFRVSCWAL